MKGNNICTPGLQFDPEAHAYAHAGRRLVSVTQVLDRAGMVEGTEWFTEESRERGRAVHAAIHYYDEGDLDEESLHEKIRPYLDAYKAWLADTRATTFGSEIALADTERGYAGTLDRLCWMGAVLGKDLALLDFKSGAPCAAHSVQLAAYNQLVRTNRALLGLELSELPTSFWIVQLSSDGKYHMHEPQIDMKTALAYFWSALNVVRFKETYHNGTSYHE